MEHYITKVKSLVNALAKKDLKLPEEFVLNQVLNSLTSQYDSFIANITQALRVNKNAYNLSTLTTTLLDESRRIDSIENNQIMVVKKPTTFTSRNKVTKPYTSKIKAKNAQKKEKGAYYNHCKVATHFTHKYFYLFPKKAPKGQDSQRDPTRKSKAFEKREARILNIINDNTKNTTTSTTTSTPSKNTTSENTSTITSENTTTNSSSEDLIDFDQIDIEQPSEYSIDLFGDYIAEKSPTQVYITLQNTTPNTEYLANQRLDLNNIEKDLKTDLQNTKVLNTYSNSNKYKANFIIDTAVESHIIYDKQLYYSFKECDRKVSWGNAKSIQIKGIRNIYIEFIDTNIRILLRNCLYMLELGINLIS